MAKLFTPPFNQPLEKFIRLIHDDQKQLYQVYFYSIFKGIISLSLPLGIQTIINLLQGGQVSSAWLLLVLIIVAGITFAGVLQILQLRITETIQQKIFARAAFDFAYRIPRIEFEEISKHNAPELMNRFFEIPVLQKSVSKVFIELPAAMMQIFFALIVLSFYHPFFISFSLLLLFFIVILMTLTAKKGLHTSIIESKHKFKAASWLEELARVKDTFKLAGKTDFPLKKMNTLAENYVNAREDHYGILNLQYIILLIFKIAISAAFLLIGGYLVLDQKMNFGQFVSAEIIILLIIESSEKLILNFDTIYDVQTSLEKINEVTDMSLQPDNSAIAEPIANPAKPISVELYNVSYQFPGNPELVFKDLNYAINAGQIVSITGVNGSGKSTLLHLISGLFKPTKGNILINGFHIENYNRENLYQYFGNGLVDESIFNGTLAENISLGRENISTEDIVWAINNTGLGEYLKKLPEGLNTQLELSGAHLPESIYNKIIIARSIVNRPKLLLFEINTSNFETNERKKIIDFLTDKANSWTLIFISSDDYFNSKADVILRIDNRKNQSL